MLTDIRKIFIIIIISTIIIIIIITLITINAVIITKQYLMLKDMKPTWPYRCVLQIADTPGGRLQVRVSIPK